LQLTLYRIKIDFHTIGWVLRELSVADEDIVICFIKNHYDEFTREGLRYAIEKMNKPLQKQLLNYDKKKKKNK